MRISKNKLIWFMEIYNEMIEVGRLYYKIRNGYEPDKISIDVEESGPESFLCVYEQFSERGYSSNHQSYCIPSEYLWTYDWEEKLRAEILKENIKAVAARIQKEKEEAIRKEANDRILYEKLKVRFEPMEQLGPEFQKVLDENRWELYESS